MRPPERKKKAAAQEAFAAATNQGKYDSTNSSSIAQTALSRNRRARIQTPPVVAMYVLNRDFELCAVECPDGLNRLRLRAAWEGPGKGKLYTLDAIRREDRYVGHLNWVDWWLRQPERREAPDFKRSLAVRP